MILYHAVTIYIYVIQALERYFYVALSRETYRNHSVSLCVLCLTDCLPVQYEGHPISSVTSLEKMKNRSKLKYTYIFIVTSVLFYAMFPSFWYLGNTGC